MKKLLTTSLILATNLFITAHAAAPYAGQYQLITPTQPTNNPDKVEVVSVFRYSCPHCNYFEKTYLKNWLSTKPDYVEFMYMPAVFKNDRQIPLAKAYYTAEALDVVDKVHKSIFRTIHEDKPKSSMNNETTLQRFFAKYGVIMGDFTEAYNGFYVDTKMRQAEKMAIDYDIRSVPTIIINGKYRLTSDKAKGYINMMKIINYLIEREHKLITAPQATTK